MRQIIQRGHNGEEHQRSVAIQDAVVRPQKNRACKSLPVIFICCALIVLGLIAGTIVLSLIPVYLSQKSSTTASTASSTSIINVNYGTNILNTNSLIVANPNALSVGMMNALGLTGIVVSSAGFLQPSIARIDKKRRAANTNNNQCQTDPGTTGNLFNIGFTVKYPVGCSSAVCQTNFNATAQLHVVNQHPKINLAIPFTIGTLNVELIFCAFSSTSGGKQGSGASTNTIISTTQPTGTNILTSGSSNTSVVTGITKIVINSPNNTIAPSVSPTFGGRTFGNVGAYEKLRGIAYGQLDPNDTHNTLITDLKLALRNNMGMVEYAMDFYILKPINLSMGNHKLFFEVNNRGSKAFGPFSQTFGGNNPTTASDAGQAFLMNQGYTMAWSGWDPSAVQTGLPNSLLIYLPIATNLNGSSITGPSYEYIVIDNPITTSYTTYYNTSSMDTTKATLTMRNHLTDLPMNVPSTDWTWISSNRISLLPLNTAFKQSWIYELVYTAKDPYVAGIGFAATRDFVSFLRSTRADNPLTGDTTRVISWSLSQPARYMNDFIWLGFNEDLNRKQVFDGVFNWVGAGTGVGLNYRFAQPGRTERNRQEHLYPEVRFPFSYTILTDSLTGKIDGRNKRCIQTSNCPKIININSANEYWVKTCSLLHSDLAGNDIVDPPNVRHFLLSGAQHAINSSANSLGICQQFGNTIDPSPALRALFVALDQWLDGTDPPASMIPRHSDSTAVFSNTTSDSPLGIGIVTQISLSWPTIPNVLYTGLITVCNLFNFGPQFDNGIISIEPPNSTGMYYPSFVSKVDIDGNELAGIRLPPIAVPFGTNAGWNLRSATFGGNDGCESTGSLIPFAPDMATRMAKGDTRLSLTERYGNHSGYVAAVTTAANALAIQRLLLAADVQAYINAAQAPIQVINNPTYGNYTW